VLGCEVGVNVGTGLGTNEPMIQLSFVGEGEGTDDGGANEGYGVGNKVGGGS
jgi:hypothetical protein